MAWLRTPISGVCVVTLALRSSVHYLLELSERLTVTTRTLRCTDSRIAVEPPRPRKLRLTISSWRLRPQLRHRISRLLHISFAIVRNQRRVIFNNASSAFTAPRSARRAAIFCCSDIHRRLTRTWEYATSHSRSRLCSAIDEWLIESACRPYFLTDLGALVPFFTSTPISRTPIDPGDALMSRWETFCRKRGQLRWYFRLLHARISGMLATPHIGSHVAGLPPLIGARARTSAEVQARSYAFEIDGSIRRFGRKTRYEL